MTKEEFELTIFLMGYKLESGIYKHPKLPNLAFTNTRNARIQGYKIIIFGKKSRSYRGYKGAIHKLQKIASKLSN